MEEFLYLGDLVDEIVNELSDAHPLYQMMIAKSLHVDVVDKAEVLDRIREVLTDPNTKGRLIAGLGSELLGQTFTYQGDSVVHVLRGAKSATAARRLLEILHGAGGGFEKATNGHSREIIDLIWKDSTMECKLG